MAMKEIFKLLLEGERLTTKQMALILAMETAEIEAELEALSAKGILLGWRPIIHPDHIDDSSVRAVIEVKMNTERGGGFDRIAERVSKFQRVESCYLMSGTYDLMVVLRAEGLKRVASFVYEKLASIEGVVSTTTHFVLKAYKEQGFLLQHDMGEELKPVVS